jgi:uncharacterized protein (DUF305 family)
MKRPEWRVIGVAALAACGGARAAAPAPASAPAAAPHHAPFTAADVHFMSGMIAHHEQAVLIAGWAATHEAGSALRVLSERVVVAQQDEIAFARRWLDERGQALMAHAMLMPGMLTPDQLAQLDRARGPEFDRLFLTLMIQHHEGALTMVQQLLGTQGAAQDGLVFRFAADVHADQTTEIARMRRMLAALPNGGKTP